jgi:tetratricopeptide (TPR) repeat protein
MGFWKALFGSSELTPEEEKKEQQAKNFDLLKYDGVKAMKMGQTDYAVRCFREALKIQDDLEIHDHLSRELMRMGELRDAYEELSLLERAEPRNAQVLVRMTQVAFMEEDYQLMDEVCQRLLQLDDKQAGSYLLSAQAQIGLGHDEEAITLLTKAIELGDGYAEAYLLRGQTLLRMGKVEDAASDTLQLLDLVGNQEDALLLKARVEVARGHRDLAQAIYNKVIEVNPFSVEAFSERALLKRQAGDDAGADEDLKTAHELDPTQDVQNIEQQVREAYQTINPLGL